MAMVQDKEVVDQIEKKIAEEKLKREEEKKARFEQRDAREAREAKGGEHKSKIGETDKPKMKRDFKENPEKKHVPKPREDKKKEVVKKEKETKTTGLHSENWADDEND